MEKKLTKKEAKKRVEKLRKEIRHHDYLYYVLDKPIISDAAYDSLKRELIELEKRFPEFITLDSPTQRIGGEPLEKFEKVRHPVPMLSFDDAFSEKEMKDWLKRVSRLLSEDEVSEVDYYCELKIDGLAIELTYEDEILRAGSTRGDGIIGEDVTQNLKTIGAVPLRLREKKEVIKDLEKIGLKEISAKIKSFPISPLVVRGEVFISKKEFKRVNKIRKKAGLSLYANPRNLAAGSIRQLDPKVTAKRHLDSFAYDLITDLGQSTHEQKHQILKAFGFKTNPHNQYCKDLNDAFKFHERVRKLREKIDYEIDGVVVIINSNKFFEKLGVVGKAPRGAIAYKFPLKQATTIIEDIKVQVGRTGALTPVAYLKPVKVGGVTISRATLHNEDEIKRLGVKIGDTVIVGRAGDVIPDVIKVLSKLRTGKEKEFHFPKRCPVCGSETIRPKGEAVWRCPNPKCFARRREYFHHFVSKAAFNIVGLGPKITNRLLDESLVQDPSDLFQLKEGDLVLMERFAEKSAKKLIEAIQKRKKITLPRFIFALGIKNVGEETALDLAEHFGSLEKLTKASFEELEKIRDIGSVVAKSIYDWFHERRNLKFLEKLKKAGIEIISEKKAKYQPLKGKIFVLTGSLEKMPRKEAKEKIRSLGGKISESVSKKTDYVIVGKKPGSKYEKAKEWGIKMIEEKEFLEILK